MGFGPDDREKLGKIEQHLETLNGKVERNAKDIEDNRCEIRDNMGKLKYWAGFASSLGALGAIVGVASYVLG